MNDKTNNKELERFIFDWHWDKKSHKLAKEMGQFLFDFLDSICKSSASERTYRSCFDNCWCIGKLSGDYGYHKKFSPTIFLCGPGHLIEFKRKQSDSNYAIEAYSRTWRKLERYVRSLGFTDEDDE